MADHIAAMCEQLIKALNVTMDAESTQIYRLEALKFFEEFKEKSDLCVPCGLNLADKAHAAVIRHLGLQILEHVIKYRWNDMQQQEKVQVKDCTMQLLLNGTHSILEEESYIKDVLSRVVVEMIKREWPQNWSNMLEEMESLSGEGATQTELVMLILLRLAEDVITFHTLPHQRRRDIQQTLSQNMESIFSFLMAILQLNIDDYQALKGSPEHEMKARAHCKVAVATLNTLAGYIDWVSLVYITSGNCRLLESLCLLLGLPELQLEAAECLLIAISRKGKLEERKPFMLLFDDVAINYILSAAQSADGPTSSESQTVQVVERRYLFLKRLCQVLCALGSQFVSLVGSEVKVEVPPNLNKYLEALLAFTTHSSLFLKTSTLATWASIFRHETLSRDPVILEAAVKYLKTSTTILFKTGFPSRNDNPSCQYSRVDFDNDEDFNPSFNSFRARLGEGVRCACKLVPSEAFLMAAMWLKYQLNDSNTTTETGDGLGSQQFPPALQWEAVTIFMDCVISQILRSVEEEKLPVDQSMELLQGLLNYKTKDPVIMSCVLTNVSALFPFIKNRLQLLPGVLCKLFETVTFEPVQENKAPRTRAVNNLRRHACSSIIKICRDYPQFFSPSFDMFYNRIKEMFASDGLLTFMEKSALMESLVLISNEFKDFEKQKAFIDELLAPVMGEWTSDATKEVVCDPAAFMSFVGADQVVSEQRTEVDTAGLNRGRLGFCLNAVLGVAKRARWPADLEAAKSGGFVVAYTSSAAPIFRNACAAQFLAFLPNLLALVRTLNSLFMPENRARLSETFTRVHDLMDAERNLVLGLAQPPTDTYDAHPLKTNLERMQGFFSQTYDTCFHLLGNAALSLQQDFYNIDGLSEKIAASAFFSLEHVPDHRLRPVIRMFLKQMVLSCPVEYHDNLLCPLLGPLFSYVFQSLNMKWQVINQRTAVNGEENEEVVCQESQETQELLEEQLVRLLTREVLDFIIVSCISRKLPEPAPNKEEIEEEDGMMDATPVSSAASATEELTELGKTLMKDENIYMSLLSFSFTSLSWKDATYCHRTASIICWTLLRQVIGRNILPEAVSWFYISVLKALQVHGQHEVCSASLSQLAMHIYDNLRPRYAELRLVMNQIPNINTDFLELYDRRLLDPNAQKVAEKKRKDQFKKLIAGTVGKALCHQFKKEVHIKNLPSLFKKAKPETDVLSSEEISGIAVLLEPEKNSL
ncbi:exportin-5-like isoform X2 [Nerophis ophidion]|uniref:exportin-5-like isoform X2 n=1 Tax=Nerophis ophidion TaxID=159077 RepID=UPI002AE01BA3|nr:exportin-5-like isoform X2 [Nerophis ophidion]XP_061766062.1 exportin-5-like isoform X2 [Nerophis ophidion]